MAVEHEANAGGARVRCPECAAGMAFDAASGQMACAYCGARVAVERAAGVAVLGARAGGMDGAAVVEHDLERGLAAAARGYGAPVRRARCAECGAIVSFGEAMTATRCDFCAADAVLLEADHRQVLRPESLVPFAIDAGAARAAFARWIGALWFRPSDLRRLAAVSETHGVYVPYWTFDCQVDSRWTAQSGTYYYETERYTAIENGRSETRTREVRRVRWWPSAGERADHHDDVLVCASRGLPAELAARLDTFDTGTLVPWQPAYLAGWKAEEYAVELREGWEVAAARVAAEQERRCAGDVPGDTHRGLEVDNRFSRETWKHVLLPVWIAAYRYRGEVYRFLVNGQTGEVEGKAPWSAVKIVLAVVVGLALVAAVFALRGGCASRGVSAFDAGHGYTLSSADRDGATWKAHAPR